MKFLIFNAAVIAALAYLFTGGDFSATPMLDTARDLISKVTAKAAPLPVTKATAAIVPKQLVTTAPIATDKSEAPRIALPVSDRRAVDTPKLKVEVKREPSPAPAVIAEVPREPSLVPIPASTPELAPFTGTDKDGLPLIDVEREVARVEPKIVPIPAPAPMAVTAPTPQYMSPSERRRELSKLARAMEDMFLRHSASD
ncbi:MAG: hypothetical protein HOH65_15775 [Rhodospirillaceae bacterium]|jgi:hypothetical protein|nr:hypothetical protein [Rhodospirillaceae bacterium]